MFAGRGPIGRDRDSWEESGMGKEGQASKTYAAQTHAFQTNI
jgi:hypothetical protein